jgi:hypothetical protein
MSRMMRWECAEILFCRVNCSILGFDEGTELIQGMIMVKPMWGLTLNEHLTLQIAEIC